MSIRELYVALNGDYEDILGRLRSDDLILRFLRKFLDEPSYAHMCSAADLGDVQETILGAHRLKGVAANLSFTELCDKLIALLTSLRQENQTEIDKELLGAVVAQYEKTIRLIEEL